MTIKKLYRAIGLVAIWMFYLAFPFFIFPKAIPFSSENQLSFFMYVFISILSILLFYFNYFVAIPRFALKKQYFSYALSLILLGLLMFLAVRTYHILICSYLQNTIPINTIFLGVSYLPKAILMLFASFALFYYKRYKELETERVKSELRVLKAQINPHFFFNTLNIIYGQAITKSDKTASSISKLSQMMRYVLSDTNQELISLENEISYIKSYIELQQLRLTEKTSVNFTIDGDMTRIKVPPLLFINIIENAFKHGVSTEKETTIDIQLKLKNQVFTLTVYNDIPRKFSDEKNTKIGLANTRSRLDLLYGNNYSLDIKNEKTSYKITLKLLLEC